MDDELSVILAEIYRMIRNQREAHFQIQKMATATLQAMRTVPGFEERYGMEWYRSNLMIHMMQQCRCSIK